MAHTKGDWENRNGRIFVKGTMNSICTIELQKDFLDPLPDTEAHCNGKLIAAAPVMLEALKDLVKYCTDNNTGAELSAAMDAINQATDETP